ncbi:hypothetical protein ACF1GW_16775 [Streptomyces achromogenes]|uniref:hypothetical protein n=1 Tax=Streptomyces achromogenes TaxID=67255 RepID=UPI0036F64A25
MPPSAVWTWWDPGTVCLPAGTELEVPPLTVTDYRPSVWYWAVPPRSAGELCSAGLTDQLARYGQWRMAKWR